MERAALALSRVQPSPRAARKSEWLRSALAHHHCPDPGAENEIVVLATGIDQYLQEVFHHLACPSRDDTVSAEDFTALCAVLGLSGADTGKRPIQVKEVAGGEDKARRGAGDGAWRLPITEDTELVERQIRLRWPRVRRRKCVSFDLTRDQSRPMNRSKKGRTTEDREPDEVAALRELVEDLRSALQGSDARCLALEVALRRERSSTLPPPSRHNSTVSTPTSSITLVQGKLVPTLRIKGQLSAAGGDRARRVARKQDIRDPLLRELKLIRSSRDGQLEEAIKYNERLEEELRWAYQEVRKLQGVESALRKENAQIRRRAEEAREALSLGLQRVRLIQEQAQSVPQLQSRITQLETELHQYRTCCTCLPDPASQQTHPEDTCSKTDAECLQRAVEGRAASDEEEDGRGAKEEGQRSRLDVKKHSCRLHGCGKGCQNRGVLHDRNLSRGRCSWTGPNQEQPERSRGSEEEKRPEEDRMRPKENEKTRLSLLEDKLTDSLTLLLQLRNKNVSRSVLEKIVMDTLDVCSRGGNGPSQVLQVADALCARLSSGDLLGDGGGDEGGGEESGEKLLLPPSGRQASSVNPLLISC